MHKICLDRRCERLTSLIMRLTLIKHHKGGRLALSTGSIDGDNSDRQFKTYNNMGSYAAVLWAAVIWKAVSL